jgi:N-acetylmuramoyl-L-alanine amidase
MNDFVISSGHSLKVRGASGFIDEVDEARKVVNKVTDYLKELS